MSKEYRPDAAIEMAQHRRLPGFLEGLQAAADRARHSQSLDLIDDEAFETAIRDAHDREDPNFPA